MSNFSSVRCALGSSLSEPPLHGVPAAVRETRTLMAQELLDAIEQPENTNQDSKLDLRATVRGAMRQLFERGRTRCKRERCFGVVRNCCGAAPQPDWVGCLTLNDQRNADPFAHRCQFFLCSESQFCWTRDSIFVRKFAALSRRCHGNNVQNAAARQSGVVDFTCIRILASTGPQQARSRLLSNKQVCSTFECKLRAHPHALLLSCTIARMQPF